MWLQKRLHNPVRSIETDRKLKEVRDNNGFLAAVLMDLSKSFDTINHDLLIAKSHTYG